MSWNLGVNNIYDQNVHVKHETRFEIKSKNSNTCSIVMNHPQAENMIIGELLYSIASFLCSSHDLVLFQLYKVCKKNGKILLFIILDTKRTLQGLAFAWS